MALSPASTLVRDVFLGSAYLVAYAVDGTSAIIWNQYKPLPRLAAKGNLSELQSLIHKGADINQKDVHGETALELAAKNEQLEVVSFLLNDHGDKLLRKHVIAALIATCQSDKFNQKIYNTLLEFCQTREYSNGKLLEALCVRGTVTTLEAFRNICLKQQRTVPADSMLRIAVESFKDPSLVTWLIKECKANAALCYDIAYQKVYNIHEPFPAPQQRILVVLVENGMPLELSYEDDHNLSKMAQWKSWIEWAQKRNMKIVEDMCNEDTGTKTLLTQARKNYLATKSKA